MTPINIDFTMRMRNARIPVRSTEHAAGYDLFAAQIEFDADRHQVIVDTGLSIAFPPGYGLFLFARSGWARKHNIRLVNGVGVIDSDYRGPLKVLLTSDRLGMFELAELIQPGERVAQAVLLPVPEVSWNCVSILEETERGEGGFGSTGTR